MTGTDAHPRRSRRRPALAVALLAGLAALALPAPAGAAVRQYWVAAVPKTWDVIPNGWDPMTGTRYSPAQRIFRTVVYRQYTRGWGRELQPSRPQGIVGPILHARVGDTLLVHFKNLDTAFHRPHSMHFHGVHYRPSSDGSYVPNFSGPGADVRFGRTFTYRLVAGPDSAGVWPYHDHSPSMDQSIAGGMYGALSILGRHQRAPDREYVVFFESTDGFMTVDGRAFLGNTPVFHARVGDLVQWDVLSLGNDFHTFHVHGHRWIGPGGRPTDTQTIGPAESFELRWREDAPGTWLYHCHVEAHMMDGMIGLYRVAPRRRR